MPMHFQARRDGIVVDEFILTDNAACLHLENTPWSDLWLEQNRFAMEIFASTYIDYFKVSVQRYCERYLFHEDTEILQRSLVETCDHSNWVNSLLKKHGELITVVIWYREAKPQSQTPQKLPLRSSILAPWVHITEALHRATRHFHALRRP